MNTRGDNITKIQRQQVLLTGTKFETTNFTFPAGNVTHISIKVGANDEFTFMYYVSLTLAGEEIPLFQGLGGASNTEIHPFRMHIDQDFGLRVRTQNQSASTMEVVVFYD